MLRKRRPTLKSVKELDAFPKVPESYTKSSPTSGTISIFCYVAMIALVISEVMHYQNSEYLFHYGVDTDLDSKLKINIDMTIAMPCSSIGADILDVTNQNAETYGNLEEHDVFYELTGEQKAVWDQQRRINQHIRREYHSLKEIIWRAGIPRLSYNDYTSSLSNRIPDACRLVGSLTVNKVSGNFHITAGKLLPAPGIHAHLSLFLRESDYNFSHRIEHFSFGDQVTGIFNPLDGDEKLTEKNFQSYTYYIKVVPTEVDTSSNKQKTFQYSVTELSKVIDHSQGSHGIPGIFFKYDMSSVKVKITEQYQPIWQFLVKLCAVVGGVYATTGIISTLVSTLSEFIGCKLSDRSDSKKITGRSTRINSEPDDEVFSSTSTDSRSTADKAPLSSVSELDDSAISSS